MRILLLLLCLFAGKAYAEEELPPNFIELKRQITASAVEQGRDPAMCLTELGPEIDEESLMVDGKRARQITTTCLDTDTVCVAALHPTENLITQPQCYPIPPSVRIDAR